MRFSCYSQDLIQGLSDVTRALSARPAKPIFEGVLLEASDEGLLLTCTDGSLTIRSTVDAQITEEGRAVLPGKLFTEIVRKLPLGDVDINVNEKLIASIKCMQSRTTLSGMSAIDFPQTREMERGNEIYLPQKKLRDMINKVVFAIATDESRQVLTGCLLEVRSSEVRVIALDGFRLALQKYEGSFTLPAEKTTMECIIPGRVAQELGKIMDDSDEPATLTLERTHMSVSFGKTELLTVLLAGEYINYRQILPTEFLTSVKASTASLADAVERASLMAREGKNNRIQMHISESIMQITSNADRGDVLEEIEIYLDGKDIDIAFNARYISDVIRNTGSSEICMRFNSNVSPCVISPADGDDYLYLVLPVRTFS